MSQPQTPEEYQQAIHDDYSQFVATGPIYYEGALAYTEGQPVPATNVEAHGYEQDGLVKRVQQSSSQPNQPVIKPPASAPANQES